MSTKVRILMYGNIASAIMNTLVGSHYVALFNAFAAGTLFMCVRSKA
jgi:hypothetical protein